MDADRTIAERYDEIGLRHLLRDTALLIERVSMSVEEGDVRPAHDYAEYTTATYRRLRVPMDDLITLCEGIRAALPCVLAPASCRRPRKRSTLRSPRTSGIAASPATPGSATRSSSWLYKGA